jgi:glucokinase
VDLTIGVDVGGTKIAAGAVDATGRIVENVRVQTPATTAQAVEDGIVEAVRRLQQNHDAVAVGLAVAGFVDEKRATLRFAANLPMADRLLRETIGARVGLPVVVENDANAAAWGEHRFGGGRDNPDMCLVTVGTGLGGGIVMAGELVRGAFGVAAEFGHLRLVRPDGLPCGCGNHGCWEQYCSGSALIRQAQALARHDPVAGAALLELAGQDPDAVTGTMVTEAALAGDDAAVGLFAELGRWLGEGVASLAVVLDPATVVVGGGVSEAGDLLLDPAREAYAAALSGGSHRPHLRITRATLGNDAGLIGAADLARRP